ncbi:MAG: ABC transporter ATP-binding protein [Clostridiaceae bacterium]
MKRTFKYVTKYKLLLFIPSIAMLLAILLDMLNPYLTKLLIDNVFTNGERNLFIPILIGLTIITLSRAVLGYVKEYLFDVLSANVSVDLKKDLFNHIQNLSFSYFDNINTGELMSRIGEDADNIWKTISFGLRLFIENAIYFVIASIILFYLNFKLALICILIMLPIAYIAVKLEKKIGLCYDKISDQAAMLNTTAQENIAGVRLVKAFSRERHEINKFLKLNKENFNLSLEQNAIIARYFPNIEFLTNISLVLMITIGGIFVINGDITIGTLVAFNGYIWMLIWPMRMLGWLTNMLAQNNASAKKIYKIMDTPEDIKESLSPIRLSDLQGNIEFKDVFFKYKNEIVLKNINLKIKQGNTIAIMGTTGSGKSSLINLIGRYYDPFHGNILVDGYDLKDVSLKDFRSKMAVVSQDTFLFSDSILENIKYGKYDASLEEIKKACQVACAHEFINELEEGYDTVIGERGIGLSGGQKQRLSIARAIIRKSKILILDDATSALDMDTEYSLLKNLYKDKEKPTTFIIAHRISAVKNADLIIYLENGEIIEQGNHSALLNKKGKYYDIYMEQFKDFSDLENEVI